MSDAVPLRSFVVRVLEDLGATVSEGGPLVWVQAPEAVQRDLEVPASFALAFAPEHAGEFDAEIVAPGSYFLERLLSLGTARGRWNAARFEADEGWVSAALTESGLGLASAVRSEVLGTEELILILLAFRVTLVSDEKRESFRIVAVSPRERSAWVVSDPGDRDFVPWTLGDLHADLEAAYRLATQAVRDETRHEVDRFRSRSLGLLEEEVRRIFGYFDTTIEGIREANPTGSQDLLRAIMAERDRRLAEAVERFDPKATASLCSVRAVCVPTARVWLEFPGGRTADVKLDAWSRRIRGLACEICRGSNGPWSLGAEGYLRCARCAATQAESAPPRARPPSDTPRRGTRVGRASAQSSRGSTARSRVASERHRRS